MGASEAGQQATTQSLAFKPERSQAWCYRAVFVPDGSSFFFVWALQRLWMKLCTRLQQRFISQWEGSAQTVDVPCRLQGANNSALGAVAPTHQPSQFPGVICRSFCPFVLPSAKQRLTHKLFHWFSMLKTNSLILRIENI